MIFLVIWIRRRGTPICRELPVHTFLTFPSLVFKNDTATIERVSPAGGSGTSQAPCLRRLVQLILHALDKISPP